jgi:hypothetical protein
MVVITFPDKETQRQALGFLLGRFAGTVLRSGEHIVPECALEALAHENFSFTVKGKASYDQRTAALRIAARSSAK